MRPRNTNPSAGKRPANVGGYTKGDGTKVRGHSRSVKIARIKATWVGAAASGAVCAGILVEASFTVLSTLGVVLIAAATALGAFAGEYIEKNRPKMQAQAKARARARQAARRKPQARRRTARPTQRKRR